MDSENNGGFTNKKNKSPPSFSHPISAASDLEDAIPKGKGDRAVGVADGGPVADLLGVFAEVLREEPCGHGRLRELGVVADGRPDGAGGLAVVDADVHLAAGGVWKAMLIGHCAFVQTLRIPDLQ